jgi:YidC/Oxa1 family membrane protein insertase
VTRDPIQLAGMAIAALLIGAWLYTLPSSTAPEAVPERDERAAQAPAGAPDSAFDAPIDTSRQDPTLPPTHALSGGGAGESGVGADESLITLENDSVRIRVSNLGGRISSAELLQYNDRIGPGVGPVQLVTSPGGLLRVSLGEGALEPFSTAAYEVASQDARSLVLLREVDGIRVERVLSLDPTGYGGQLRVRLENRGEASVRPEYRLLLYGVERPSDAPDRFQQYSIGGVSDGDVERQPLAGIGSPGLWRNITGQGAWRGDSLEPPVDWMALDSQYFLAAAMAENPGEARGFVGPVGQEAGVAVLGYPPVEVPSGTRIERSYRLYLGPKVAADLAAVDPKLDGAIQAGWTLVRPLVDLFARILVWTHDNVVSNYGVAIILVTILIRLVTYPLTQKSMKSMKRLQVIAPEMKALQDEYKDDKEKLQQEIMGLYKRTGINPMTALGGGCFPMLLQFPFLIALYFALQASIELRHAGFMFWITDLSAPENLFSVAGLPVRPLPLLMGCTMVLQQRLTPSPSADPQQKQMMTMMSVAFIFLFYQFPSGLVLYWFVSNLLGILQQFWVNRAPEKPAS